MTGILPTLLLVILLIAALYLVVARPDLVAAWLYRLLRNGDPWSWQARLRARLLRVQRPSRDEWLTEVQEAELGQYGDLYPPEAAEAPDPVDEHFTTAPSVVAGQDIDDLLLIAELHAAYAKYRAGEDVFAGAIHEPSPEVKQ